MSDKPREWPNVMRDYRDEAARAAQTGIRALEPVVVSDRPMTENERLRKQAIALNALRTIAQCMQEAGAKVRAID